MTEVSSPPGLPLHPYDRARQRDRRAGIEGLLASLTPALARPALLRTVFEEATRGLVGAERLRLVELPAGVAPVEPPHATRALTVPVPTGATTGPLVLEAVSARHRAFDGWQRQLLHAATHVAALLCELERARRGGRPIPPPRVEDGAAPLIGSSAIMRALRAKVERVAETDFTILIEGESGTGKELVARQIHELSRRCAGPFIALNCAAIVDTLLEAELFGIEERTATGVRGRRGKFEHADGGTLFLDEVSDLSASAQAKLLRAIQDLAVVRVGGHGAHPVDLRIVAATNRSLSGMVAGGLFRSDLFYRLSGVEVHVPPLRARQGDIVELAEYFLERHRERRRLELSPAVKEALREYEWPGNVRELQRVVENIVALAPRPGVELDDLPPSVRGAYEDIVFPSLARDETMRAWGSRYARLMLQRCGDNKRRACEVLGISYHTLQSYLAYQERRRALGEGEGWGPADTAPEGPQVDDGDEPMAVES